jgi:hypothetical protein
VNYVNIFDKYVTILIQVVLHWVLFKRKRNLKFNKMKGFKSNIEKDTLENNNFRKVLYKGKHLQLVLMSLSIKME